MLKKIILYVVSAGVGSFVCEILGKTPMNVWFARGIGAVVAVIVAILLYKFWINGERMNEEQND